MKILLLAGLALLAAVSAGVFYSHLNRGSSPVPAEIVAKYAAWKKVFGKLYATPAENDHRLRVFYGQWQFVEESNKQYNDAIAQKGEKLSGPMFEMNGFGDLSDEEFKVRFTGAKVPEVEPSEPVIPTETVKEAKNLAQTGYQIIVRQQGSCGSCWAHAAVATLEKHYWDKTRQRLSFSHQMLVDCDTQSSGCSGGWDHNALNYAKATGIAQASSYPYTGVAGYCRAASVPRLNVQVTRVGYEYFQATNAVSRISQGKHVGGLVFATGKFRYLSNTDDIFDGPSSGECGNQMNHVITLVEGSGSTFRILNSWGTGWGVGGLKRVRACSASVLYGAYSTLSYTE